MSYLEFAHDLNTHFTRWCSVSDVDDFESLCELVVLEQFKNSLPVRVATYVSEQKAKTAAEAAALADDYTLTHRGSFGEPKARNDSRDNVSVAGVESHSWRGKPAQAESKGNSNLRESEKVCNYCCKCGH